MKKRTEIVYADKNYHNCTCSTIHIQGNTDSIYDATMSKAIDIQ